jgi:LuxR family maltose regulon positive regulatory protein
MDLPLPASALQQLETRTEGWAAGLQMAALSLRGRDDVAAFIDGFAGSHRFVLDYLMEEVLTKMEPRRREALLRLSILRELSAPIVDALLGGDDGQALLESLEAENLFLVALDDTRRTYRFHHLFGTLLRHELASALGEAGRLALHVRAAEALERGDAIDEAFHHAIEGRDFDRAQRLLLIDADVMIIRRAHEWLTVRLDRFDANETAQRPVLLVKRAWIRSATQREDEVLRAVETAREALARHPDAALTAELTLFEAVEAQHRGRMDVARPLFDIADRDLPADNALMRSVLIMHRAFDTVADDRFEDAVGHAHALAREARRTGDDFAVMWARWFGAQVALLRGRPRETIQIMESMMAPLRERFGSRPPRSAGIGFVTLAMAYHARGELEPAIEWIERALDVMDPRIDPGNGCALVLAQAEIEAIRDPAGPGWKEAIAHGERLIADTDMPGFAARLRAHRVRHCLDPRTPDDPGPIVRAWLAEPGVRTQDHPAYTGVPYPTSRKEFAGLLLARSLTHLGELDEAQAIAERFLARATAAGRQLCMAEGHVVLATLAQSRGDEAGMRREAAAAVAIAAPERLVSPFFGHPDGVVDAALDHARAAGHMSLAGYLAAHLGNIPSAPRVLAPVPVAPARGDGAAMADPLSDRELEVLGLVAEGMSNAEIGRTLYVAPSTVKKHLEHVYDKLGVRRRTQAVARARTLSLL